MSVSRTQRMMIKSRYQQYLSQLYEIDAENCVTGVPLPPMAAVTNFDVSTASSDLKTAIDDLNTKRSELQLKNCKVQELNEYINWYNQRVSALNGFVAIKARYIDASNNLLPQDDAQKDFDDYKASITDLFAITTPSLAVYDVSANTPANLDLPTTIDDVLASYDETAANNLVSALATLTDEIDAYKLNEYIAKIYSNKNIAIHKVKDAIMRLSC